ncbi:lipoprotein-releasing ABC transporter permease subunit LolE [Orbus sturtevantii]|uniref:lipoprotein-releasing ABC transporter permease subunit LolE n=1 Tax=Orbus sturtevantii TaxID=3074109 RepID=UPI00370D4180
MLSLFLARKFRRGRRQSGMLSLISIISTLSIAIGIAALIIGLSAMNGFEKELKNRVLSVIPHGEFYSPNGTLPNWRAIQSQIDHGRGIVSSAPFISFTGLIENSNKIKAVQVQGIDLEQEAKMSILPTYILDNKWPAFKQDNKQIIIGVGLADSLDAKEGDWITLLIPTNDDSSRQLKQPKRIRLSVAGIMNFSGTLGNSIAFIPLSDAQQYLNLGDNVTGIKVNVDNIYNANYIIHNIAMDIATPLYITSWEQNYGYMYHDIQMIRQIMYLAMVVVISVACFSIVSTLVIAVKDKQRDIAILKTLGATNQLISKTFIFYGMISGFVGSIIGVLIGIIISLQLSTIIHVIESLIGRQLLNSHIYFIDFLPSELHLTDIMIVFCTAMVLTLVASYYPARRACKLDPVKILNGF